MKSNHFGQSDTQKLKEFEKNWTTYIQEVKFLLGRGRGGGWRGG